MKKTKLLLSGGSSFLGLKFSYLFGSKYDITTFSRHDIFNPIDLLDLQQIQELVLKVKPAIIVHLAATSDRNDQNINETNFIGTKNIVEIAQEMYCPIVFMSSESVYGGNFETESEIQESRDYNPKSDYAKSKVKSEELIKNSSLPYLIMRGHRFIGFVGNYNKQKQFPDTMKAIFNDQEVHLDSEKIFTPSFINHVARVIDHYISNDISEQRILNTVVTKDLTYFKLIKDICCKLELNKDLIRNDGKENGWEQKSVLSSDQLKRLGYPQYSYNEMLEQLKEDFVLFYKNL